MTKILIAADSFKGSASSIEISNYLEVGIKKADSNAQVYKYGIADGGEGTVDSVVNALNGRIIKTTVTGPLGESVSANWGMVENHTAVIEVAEPSGITLIKDRLNPDKTTTYGVGELIKKALDQNAKKIYVGLGGSATNDGGVGMAQALGVHFLDEFRNELSFGGGSLVNLAKIDISQIDPRLKNTTIIALSDVSNPLVGKTGATVIFGPQKGATKDQVVSLEKGLRNLADKTFQVLNKDLSIKSGAGAAGGVGFGLMAFCNATVKSGITEIMKLIHLEQRMKDVDLVITGEGQIDGQSVMGKVPIGVAKLAKKFDLPVIAVAGSVGSGIEQVYQNGIDLVLSSTTGPMSLKQAILLTPQLLEQAGYTAYKAFSLNR
ncbi:glycerate kinase family protein [Companilactobacillus keshanensis]|uniref:Glycerate kinase n=1 Tax=Companilactobacillus keshanensis TaxID=2486003 RepID=A0ABW4BTI7_9LACO|nr:glycerate kinase [Companilactobacillus keshanensis]